MYNSEDVKNRFERLANIMAEMRSELIELSKQVNSSLGTRAIDAIVRQLEKSSETCYTFAHEHEQLSNIRNVHNVNT